MDMNGPLPAELAFGLPKCFFFTVLLALERIDTACCSFTPYVCDRGLGCLGERWAIPVLRVLRFSYSVSASLIDVAEATMTNGKPSLHFAVAVR